MAPNELRPQDAARAVETIALGLVDDLEATAILRAAREALRALSFNRFAARHTASSRAYRLRRRHQGRRGVSNG